METENLDAIVPVMSGREKLQRDLAVWMADWCTAPYGVIEALVPATGRKGFGRAITFGLAGTLDATVTIWSCKRLELITSRGQSERFDSEVAFTDYCVANFGACEWKTS